MKKLPEQTSTTKLHETFSQHFSTSSQHLSETTTAWAPGRVNLIGEHTDYNDGYVFPMALELGVAVHFRPRKDDKVRLYAANPGEVGEFSLSSIARSDTQPWLNYPMGVAKELLQAGADLKGLEGVIDGNLPIGAGLSSSAALEVASALAFLQAAGEAMEPLELARLCRRAENDFVGLNCGIMDQFIALFARTGTALFLDTRSLDHQNVLLPSTNEYVVMICDSQVKHSLATSQYNLRHRECEEALKLLKLHLPHIKALRDVSIQEFCAHRDALPQPLSRRAEHVIFENDRTLRAREALANADVQSFGRLMDDSHESLRDLYEVSCAELDLLVDSARKIPGVMGSRMTGGGFGGCTVSLVEARREEEFCDKLSSRYKGVTGLECHIFVSKAAGAAAVS
ncbi:MAG: galactokinase [Armatimonadetes bacterium]|nr:galactokinase [Armatimonadota bacterium]NIO74882.1 galactokinase [Armatimonadota bacterium]NIO95643.1 galactokinase [Armatimonadota bacterium]